MSDIEHVQVTVDIMGKEFQIACPRDEEEALLASARILSDRMKAIRETGKIFGTDRIAIVAALNLTHELLQKRDETQYLGQSLSQRIDTMCAKIEGALQETQQMEI